MDDRRVFFLTTLSLSLSLLFSRFVLWKDKNHNNQKRLFISWSSITFERPSFCQLSIESSGHISSSTTMDFFPDNVYFHKFPFCTPFMFHNIYYVPTQFIAIAHLKSFCMCIKVEVVENATRKEPGLKESETVRRQKPFSSASAHKYFTRVSGLIWIFHHKMELYKNKHKHRWWTHLFISCEVRQRRCE